ncbi:phospholipase type enzyme [Salix suchowensis]|nr:phospholipase type enzyme [Salix suchowensis]
MQSSSIGTLPRRYFSLSGELNLFPRGSGALGAGLAIFSRFPIVASHIHPYSLNGSPIDVSAGDCYSNIEAACQLFAKGGEAEAHRYVNAWELAKLILQAAELGRYVIAPGDYNSIPTTLPMTIIKDYAGLSDAWSVTHPNTFSNTPPNRNSSTSPPDPAVEAITKYGVTADSPLCTYSAGKPLDGHALQFCGKRLDYILFRHPHPQSINRTEKRNAIVCTHCKVVLTECVPEYDFSYSDHFGLEATFTIRLLRVVSTGSCAVVVSRRCSEYDPELDELLAFVRAEVAQGTHHVRDVHLRPGGYRCRDGLAPSFVDKSDLHHRDSRHIVVGYDNALPGLPLRQLGEKRAPEYHRGARNLFQRS